MDTGLESYPPDRVAILKLIKDALAACRESSSRLCGFARGLEIGISTIQGAKSAPSDTIEQLNARALRLSASLDEYNSGVALGIKLSADVST